MRELSDLEPAVSPSPDQEFPPGAGGFLSRLCARLFQPVDISFLVFFRIVFGAIMTWEAYRFLRYDWISRYYIQPAFHFTYYGFSWVTPWAGRGMYIHFLVLGVAAFCILIGFCYRVSAPLFFFGFAYVFLLDQTRYLNHFYLVCLVSFLLMFMPAHRAFSVDSWLRPKIRSDVVPAWTLWLLRAQIGIAYFYGGIAKLNSDWVRGGEPMRTWLRPLMRFPAIGPVFQSEWVVYGFVYGGLLADLLIVPLLLWRRTRLFAFFAAVTFNLINALIFDIGIFPWFMLGATFIFFPPDLMRRFARAFMTPGAATRETHDSDKTSPAPETCPSLTSRQKVIAVVLVAYMAIQLLFPLRHFLYPGNVSWTEEGHNFAWHMKLRTKRGEALFTVTHPPTGQTWTVDPRDHLEWRQVMKMTTKPHLILQFSHHLAEEKRKQGYDNVEVRARVMASLNGREPQLLIDPTVDLARERASLLHAPWIMPLTTPLEKRGTATQEDSDEDN
jgi:vitamin K-dependent gamma-carboxylase